MDMSVNVCKLIFKDKEIKKMKITLLTVHFYFKLQLQTYFSMKCKIDYIATYMKLKTSVKTKERNSYRQSTFQYLTWPAFNV